MSVTIPTTIVCNRCHRVWPKVSEQGVHTSEYGHCYHCMLTWVTKRLYELQLKVDYIINTCNICAGVEEKRKGCRQCKGTGYVVDNK